MARRNQEDWIAATVDQSDDVTAGTIEILPETFEQLKNPSAVAVCPATDSDPTLQIRTVKRQRLAAMLSPADYKSLKVEANAPRIRLRRLTRGESIRRTTKRMSLPVLAFAGVTAVVAGAALPGIGWLVVVGAGTGIPSAAVGAWKSRKDA